MLGSLRFVLIIAAVICFASMLHEIRKSKMLIDHAVFWVGFSLLLVILAIFPQIASWASKLLGIESPSNFVFMLLIFVLIVREFRVTMRFSNMQIKLDELAENIAINEAEREKDTDEK